MGYVSLQAPPSLFLGQPGFAEGFLSNSFPPKPEATEVPEVLRVKKKQVFGAWVSKASFPCTKEFCQPTATSQHLFSIYSLCFIKRTQLYSWHLFYDILLNLCFEKSVHLRYHDLGRPMTPWISSRGQLWTSLPIWVSRTQGPGWGWELLCSIWHLCWFIF